MPEAVRYFHFCSHEQFPPGELLEQAVRAEAAGFDGIACSDHLQPWWEPGESAHAWPWLGAAGARVERLPFGTGVTPPGPRYHPVLIAQAWATLEAMFPGRPFLGMGSGESLNESPLGEPWPPVAEQIHRHHAIAPGGDVRRERVVHAPVHQQPVNQHEDAISRPADVIGDAVPVVGKGAFDEWHWIDESTSRP